jgi:hypothetical protein
LILLKLHEGKDWPELPRTTGIFEKIALRELKAAAQMDDLACRRALSAKALRAGKDVKKSELVQLGKSMKEMSKEFKQLWLLRNKTSRLQDNLKLFKQAELESHHLADKRNRL